MVDFQFRDDKTVTNRNITNDLFVGGDATILGQVSANAVATNALSTQTLSTASISGNGSGDSLSIGGFTGNGIVAILAQNEIVLSSVGNKVINLQGTLAGQIQTATGTDAGVQISSTPIPYALTITPGTESGPFALLPPVTPVSGTVIHVANLSTQPTTGLVTPAGGGGVFMFTLLGGYVKIA